MLAIGSGCEHNYSQPLLHKGNDGLHMWEDDCLTSFVGGEGLTVASIVHEKGFR